MKPTRPCIDSAWRERAVVMPCALAQIEPFLRKHYLRKRPGTVVLSLVVMVDVWAVGAVTFSLPPTQTSERYGGMVVWELSRLYLNDDVPANAESWVIAQAVRYVRENHRDIDLLVSYADTTRHNGTIYRASNWVSDGATDSDRATPRFDLADAATGKVFGRAKHAQGRATVRVYRTQKLRFLMPLTKRAKKAQAA